MSPNDSDSELEEAPTCHHPTSSDASHPELDDHEQDIALRPMDGCTADAVECHPAEQPFTTDGNMIAEGTSITQPGQETVMIASSTADDNGDHKRSHLDSEPVLERPVLARQTVYGRESVYCRPGAVRISSLDATNSLGNDDIREELSEASPPDPVHDEPEEALHPSAHHSVSNAILVDEHGERVKQEELAELQQRSQHLQNPQPGHHASWVCGVELMLTLFVVSIGTLVTAIVIVRRNKESGGAASSLRAPSAMPTASPTSTYICVENRSALVSAVDAYINDTSPSSVVSLTYGWPIGTWCVSEIEDFSEVFSAIRNPAMAVFDEDLFDWDTSSGETFAQMFRGTMIFNQDLSMWNLNLASDLSGMFYEASSFNGNVSHWKVSAVKDMSAMFRSAQSFNQDLSFWDLSSCVTLRHMFEFAPTFNGNIGSWDVSNVKDFLRLFHMAFSFNQDISSWDVSGGESMQSMFDLAFSFNQDLSGWNLSSSRDMAFMFFGAIEFNQDLSRWDVSNAKEMWSMFEEAVTFDQDLSLWNVSNAERTFSMFTNAASFNGDLSTWDTSKVRDCMFMFKGATSFNSDISNWNTSKFMRARYMFMDATSFNQDLGSWDVGQVSDFIKMFAGATSFNQDLSHWNVGRAKSFDGMFQNATTFNQNLCRWGSDLSGSNALVSNLFVGTACPLTTELNLQATPSGPFCMPC